MLALALAAAAVTITTREVWPYRLWEDVVDIVLAVATLVVAAAVLYVTLTLSQRIRADDRSADR